jgi:succinyl-diaminopimelate desuccinylase
MKEHDLALRLLEIDTTVKKCIEKIDGEDKIFIEPINPEIIETTINQLKELGYNPIPLRDSKNKDRVAAIFAEGSNCNIAFQGHLDTVSKGDWDKHCTYNWLGQVAENEDGKKAIFGRGAIDMKGQIGSFFAALYETDKRPHVILTTDEEKGNYSGFAGINNTLEYMQRKRINPELFVNMEASSFNITCARKGAITVEILVNGLGGHGSTPDEGINSIYRAADVIKAIQTHIEELKQFRDPVLGYRPMNVGRINGGNEVNKIPENTVINLESRLIPGETGEQATTKLIYAIEKNTHFTHGKEFVATLGMNYPPYRSSKELAEKYARIIPNAKGIGGGIGFAEDNFISQAGLEVIGFGPTDKNAHAPGEHITFDDLTKAKEGYLAIMKSQ